jgi:hypothetical protein
MKCRECQKKLVEKVQEKRNSRILSGLQEHISQCETCARLEIHLILLRDGIAGMDPPRLSHELDQKTRMLCQSRLNAEKTAPHKNASPSAHATPKTIWAVLIGLTALSSIWIVPALKDFQIGDPLTFKTGTALAFLLQNSLMLFFTPLLLRQHHWLQPLRRQNSRLSYR